MIWSRTLLLYLWERHTQWSDCVETRRVLDPWHKGLYFQGIFEYQCWDMITPLAQPDDAHRRHPAHHHHTPAHITSEPEKKKERGCDQTRISQLANVHTFHSAAEIVHMNLTVLWYLSLQERWHWETRYLFDCFQIWKLHQVCYGEFSVANSPMFGCWTTTNLTTSVNAPSSSAHRHLSFSCRSPMEWYTNNVCILLPSPSSPQKSITPTVFLLGYYQEPMLP